MKALLVSVLVFVFFSCCFGQPNKKNDKSPKTQSLKIDKQVYKTFKRIHYKDLPAGIKQLMKKSGCPTIGADPSQNNDYRTNYDEGFVIDLNDDNNPEYFFSCYAEMHGPGFGNIYFKTDKEWTILYNGFSIFENTDPNICVSVLTTKHDGFHDLVSTQELTYRKLILRFINNYYREIYSPDEVIDEFSSLAGHNKKIKSYVFGISNNPEDILKGKFKGKAYDYYIKALDSDAEAQEVKSKLIKRGFTFNDEYNSGQIIFCSTNYKK